MALTGRTALLTALLSPLAWIFPGWGPLSLLVLLVLVLVAADLLLAVPPADDEHAWADEPTRFGALARRLWDPLLACEQVGQP